MIEPIAPSQESRQTFIAVDIENRRGGEVLAIGTSYRHAGSIVHHAHSSWSEWLDWIVPLSYTKKQFRTFYAHNGGGWDWLSLVEHLLKHERSRKWTIEGMRVQSKIVILRVHLHRESHGEKTTRFCLRFVDSLYLLRSSLQKLAAKLLGAGKLDTGGVMAWDLWENDRPKFYQYLERDCEALLLVLEKSLDLIRTKVAKIDSLGMTIASTAMKVWRTGFLEKAISIPTLPSVREFLREGYRGGRVEVFNYGEFDNVSVYDVNSLYPAAMVQCKVPVSCRGDFTSIFRWKLPGVYRIEFCQRNRSIPPLLLERGTGVYEGVGSFYVPEIELLKLVDPSADIRLINGYCFHDAGMPFVSYVETLYKLRRSDIDGPVSLLAKYLLNSLYGKLAQRGERHQYISFSDPQDAVKAMQSGRKLIELNEEFSAWDETTESHVAFEHVGIAGMITSFARCILYRGLISAGKRLLYCDTDSVHLTGELNANVGDNLGQFRREFVGRGVYCGRKLYALQSVAGEEKVRAKGVTVGGSNGTSLSYADMAAIANGHSKTCEYFQPTTANEVITLGKESCTFRPRKRTLRVVRK